MPWLTSFLGRLIGLFLLILSLSMLVQKQAIVEAAGETIHHRPVMLMLGMLTLTAGLAMVLGHNVWSGGVLPVVVTAFGWITLFRGLFLLFAPPQAFELLFRAIRFEESYYVFVTLSFVLGLYLSYAAFTAVAVPIGKASRFK